MVGVDPQRQPGCEIQKRAFLDRRQQAAQDPGGAAERLGLGGDNGHGRPPTLKCASRWGTGSVEPPGRLSAHWQLEADMGWTLTRATLCVSFVAAIAFVAAVAASQAPPQPSALYPPLPSKAE